MCIYDRGWGSYGCNSGSISSKKLFVHAKQSLVLTENVLITTGSYLRRFAFLVQSAGTKFRGITILKYIWTDKSGKITNDNSVNT